MVTFPVPASSNGACGFPALRFPVCYTSRVMRPVQPSPCGISSAAGLADFGCVYHFTPASHVGGERTDSRVPLLGGHYSASLLLRTLPPPSPLRPTSRVHRLYGLPCSAAFAAGGGGLLQLLGASLSPCCRYHPAGVEYRASQRTNLHAAFTLRKRARPPVLPPFEATCAFACAAAR
jgi:hypothetical protein